MSPRGNKQNSSFIILPKVSNDLCLYVPLLSTPQCGVRGCLYQPRFNLPLSCPD